VICEKHRKQPPSKKGLLTQLWTCTNSFAMHIVLFSTARNLPFKTGSWISDRTSSNIKHVWIQSFWHSNLFHNDNLRKKRNVVIQRPKSQWSWDWLFGPLWMSLVRRINVFKIITSPMTPDMVTILLPCTSFYFLQFTASFRKGQVSIEQAQLKQYIWLDWASTILYSPSWLWSGKNGR